ncbi:MAG: hypothetical protein IKO72_16495 [Kiritimatiellae bacterium]|nr:hypothetical protein [Kiritimatiellia bacterium]
MNADVEELVAGDPDAGRLVAALRRSPQAHVAAGFSARVMAEVRAQRRRAWLSAPTVFAAAASLVALLAVASIFSRPMPKPSLAAWVEPPLTVRLAPYDPADWYSPLACEEAPREAGCAAEPFCTREALAMLRLR